MPIFLLTPVDLNASDWAFSTTRESVQVEAPNEERARRRACLFFGVSAERQRGKAGRAPWDQRQLVIARVVDEPDRAVRLILAGDEPG